MASPSLKIDHAPYVLTLDPRRRIIRDGTILVEDGRIRRVGKAAELADARADRVIDARHLLVTPGFVNGHMHISYAHAVRCIFPDDVGSPLPTVFKLQLAMTEEEEHATSLLGIVELLKNGTVCFLDPGSTKYPDACLQAYEDAGIRVILGEGVTDREAPFPLPRYPTDDGSEPSEMLRRIATEGLHRRYGDPPPAEAVERRWRLLSVGPEVREDLLDTPSLQRYIRYLESNDLDGWIERFSKYPRIQLIDLDAAMSIGTNDALVRQIAARLPCRVGGGVRSVGRAEDLIAAGAQAVIVGSAFFDMRRSAEEGGIIKHDFARALRERSGASHALAVLVDVDAGAAVGARHVAQVEHALPAALGLEDREGAAFLRQTRDADRILGGVAPA